MASTPSEASHIVSIPLEMVGCRLALHTDSQRVAKLASDFFPLPSAPADCPPQAVITLRTRDQRLVSFHPRAVPVFRGRNEFVHADYASDGSIWFDLKAAEIAGCLSEDLVADAEYFKRAVLSVIAGLLAPRLGLTCLHAGCVVQNGKAVLLAAPSGVGKSTLTLSLALRGWSLLSDDWTFVSEAHGVVHVWGMQTSIKLLPDAANYFPSLSSISPQPALNGELSYEIDPWSFFNIPRSAGAELAGVVFLARDPAQSTGVRCEISQCSVDGALSALAREIEEQPNEAYATGWNPNTLLHKVATFQPQNLRVCGPPDLVAQQVDQILQTTFVDDHLDPHGAQVRKPTFEIEDESDAVLPSADTDMLRRRLPLTRQYLFIWKDIVIAIKTDSALIGRAVHEMEEPECRSDIAHQATWEIAVEASGAGETIQPPSTQAEAFETCRFGPSRGVRTVTGSWFACTPPSFSGVGFANVIGNEDQQVNQLIDFIQIILSSIANSATILPISLAQVEVCA
jgi:hypothetical protein